MEHTKQSTIQRLSKINPVWASIIATPEWDKYLLDRIDHTYDEKGRIETDMERCETLLDGHTGYGLGSPACCIIGEAHGHSDMYLDNCIDCYHYSLLFFLRILKITGEPMIELETEPDWITHINKFLDHFAENHANPEQKEFLKVA